MVSYPSEAEIPRKHAKQVQHDQQGGHPHHAKPPPALLYRQRQVRRKPGEQSPPGEHSEKVEEQERKRMPHIRRAKNLRETFVVLPWIGLGNAWGIVLEIALGTALKGRGFQPRRRPRN